jgi:hypothetical protein
MHGNAKNEMNRLANECKGPLCTIAKKAIENGAISSKALKAALDKSGYTVNVDTKSRKGRAIVTVTKGKDKTVVAQGSASDADEALMHAVYAEMRTEKK